MSILKLLATPPRALRRISEIGSKRVLVILMKKNVFHQVESSDQKKQANLLIREYPGWLDEIIRRDCGIEFDVEAMVQSDLSDPQKFYPPEGRLYLADYRDQVAGVVCLKRLKKGTGELQRMYVPPDFRERGIGRAITNRLVIK